MTFTEALNIWRQEVVADASTVRWPDAEGLRLLGQAAADIAAMLGFPRVLGQPSFDLVPGDLMIEVPGDCLDVDLDTVMVNGVRLQSQPRHVVMSKAFMTPTRYPRYYHFDPTNRAAGIAIAPSVSVVVPQERIAFQYQQAINPVVTGTDDVWGGVYPEWHWLVPIKAGDATFREVELYDRAMSFVQMFQQNLQPFAAALGKTDIAKMMVPPEARNDLGNTRKGGSLQ